MKKLIVSSALLATVLVSAQIDFSSTRYGITAGGTYSRVTNAHSPSGARYSGFGGFLALIPIDSNDQFYIQPQIEYLGAGESGKDKEAKGKNGYDAVYANNYISVPIYFKGFFSEAESEFFAMAGPRFSYLINQKVTDAPLRYTVEGDPATGINGKAASFNFGLSFGLGFSFKRQLELAVRYDLGLTDTYKGLKADLGADPNSAKNKSEQIISVGLSYILQ
ncbi:PorT family protein [Kaistella flava (ex Peng et al. 2021)]|uniref:PorT family protein n=1 Tax=Kaistella flava (ex Peng et al. 2021) TaxID=2038776 RepID=A0A7M2YB08_9FLAO|nr:porin family protein [Kaistella flava (ex Peng et al. 2021)]QOW10543.1 PorT family protein [Kaistella flava (ex Peng et al. 2021)]